MEKKMEVCPDCGKEMKLSRDSMLTIHRCVLRFHCDHCDKDWDLSGDTQRLSEVPKKDPENPCEGCYSHGSPSAMMRNCGRCVNGSLRNCIF